MMKSARLCNDMILMFPVKYCREYDYNTTILLSAVSHFILIKSDPNMNNRDKIFDEFTQYYTLQNMLENERRFCCQSVREAVFETQSYFIS